LVTRLRLWLLGIRTAEHVTGDRVDILRLLDPEAAASLLRWRLEMEGRVQASRLPRHIDRWLTTELGRRRWWIERRRTRAERRLSIARKRGERVATIDVERLDRRIGRSVDAHQRVLREFEQRVEWLQRDEERLQDLIAIYDEEMEPLEALTFRRYLRAVLGLR
jgi:hypothetical protein